MSEDEQSIGLKMMDSILLFVFVSIDLVVTMVDVMLYSIKFFFRPIQESIDRYKTYKAMKNYSFEDEGVSDS